MKNKLITSLGMFVIIVFAFATFVAITGSVSADGKTPAVVQTEKEISKNQKRIAHLRPLVQEFEILKQDNAKLVGRLEVYGYNYDWANDTAKRAENPIDSSFQ